MSSPRTRKRLATLWAQRGQAMTEMAILMVLLVPLFLLVPMLGKYSHLRQIAQQAARAVAWESTVADGYHWRSTLQDANWRERQRQLLIDRHFSLPEAPVRSNDIRERADDVVAEPMMGTFSGRALLKRSDIRVLPFSNESGGKIARILDDAGGLLERLPGEFPPSTDGLVSAAVEVRPQNLKTRDGRATISLNPFDRLDLVMTEKHTLLADAWNAAGNGYVDTGSTHRNARRVRDQIRTLVPTAFMEGHISEVLGRVETVGDLPLLGVPLRIRPGYIEPDIVPANRLEAYQQ